MHRSTELFLRNTGFGLPRKDAAARLFSDRGVNPIRLGADFLQQLAFPATAVVKENLVDPHSPANGIVYADPRYRYRAWVVDTIGVAVAIGGTFALAGVADQGFLFAALEAKAGVNLATNMLYSAHEKVWRNTGNRIQHGDY